VGAWGEKNFVSPRSLLSGYLCEGGKSGAELRYFGPIYYRLLCEKLRSLGFGGLLVICRVRGECLDDFLDHEVSVLYCSSCVS